jgi:adenine-specific DNA-methyltransferase
MSALGIRGRETMIYPIMGVWPGKDKQWKIGKEKIEFFLNRGDLLLLSGAPYLKIRPIDEDNDIYKPFWSHFFDKDIYGTAESAKKELTFFLGTNKHDFETVKPVSLIMKLIFHVIDGTGENDIILDFFSGSATTAHAVMQLNAEDGGNRRFIMVQLPESCDENSEAYKAGYKNICEIGKERIRRAGERIKEEIGENGQLKLGEDPKKVPDIGFKVFRASDTNIKWNLVESDHGQLDLDSIKDNPDVMDFTSNAKDVDVVYEIMLRQKDVPLSESMEVLSHIGNRTYLYGSSYLICLETEVTEGMVDKLAAIDPLPIKFVFRDSAFKDDISLKDETFRRLEGLIAKNSGDVKKTYTVEFI